MLLCVFAYFLLSSLSFYYSVLLSCYIFSFIVILTYLIFPSLSSPSLPFHLSFPSLPSFARPCRSLPVPSFPSLFFPLPFSALLLFLFGILLFYFLSSPLLLCSSSLLCYYLLFSSLLSSLVFSYRIVSSRL